VKAMILAAGRGERMLPLTLHTPKPLLRVGGRPLLEHHILNLKAAGFDQLVINAAYLAKQVIDFCGDGRRWGVHIEVSEEEEPLETAGGIVRALPKLGDGPFAVVNGDIWCDYPFTNLAHHVPVPGGAHLVLVANPDHNPGGDFTLSGRDVNPAEPEDTLTFSGVAVYQPDFFSGVTAPKAPLKPLLDGAISERRVSGEHYNGTWVDVGTPQRLQDLDHALSGHPA